MQTLWLNRIQTKMQNGRKRPDSEVPIVAARKRLKGMQAVDKSKTTPPLWGITNYLPPPPDGEDATTIDNHIQCMEKEFKKTKPDLRKIELLMNRTFSHRRHLIVVKDTNICEVQEMYPWLCHETQVSASFPIITQIYL